METTRRVLSALASTGIALMLGAGMAVAASGVFTSPDPVAITPSPEPVQLVDLPRSQVTVEDALTPRAEGSSPSPSEAVRRANPPRDGLRTPDAVALPDTDALANCQQTRDGEDGKNGECDALAGGGWHSGHEHDDELDGGPARPGRGNGHDR